jgi:alpha-1,3/alpha-1,6-mannosyltransferase
MVPASTYLMLANPQSSRLAGLEPDLVEWLEGGSVLLSINRYERKKHISLALKALQEVIHRHALSSGACARCRLVVAGGYDVDVPENVEHARELKELASHLGVEDRVVFLRNVTDSQRCAVVRPLAAVS